MPVSFVRIEQNKKKKKKPAVRKLNPKADKTRKATKQESAKAKKSKPQRRV